MNTHLRLFVSLTQFNSLALTIRAVRKSRANYGLLNFVKRGAMLNGRSSIIVATCIRIFPVRVRTCRVKLS